MTRLFLTVVLILATSLSASAMTVKEFIRSKTDSKKALAVAPAIERAAKKHRFDPLFVAALCWYESNFNPREVSAAGALGLAQVMPFHFDKAHPLRRWRDPGTNLDLALTLFRGYYDRMRKTYPGLSETALMHRALVAYNMGPLFVSRGVYRSRYSISILKDARRASWTPPKKSSWTSLPLFTVTVQSPSASFRASTR